MKIKKIIKKKQLPFNKERKQVNRILTDLFYSKQKELKSNLEENCVINSPLTYMQYHGGIDSIYYFGTQWGTVKVYIGDSPEDCKVEFLENQILGLINKPVETTNEQPKEKYCPKCKTKNPKIKTEIYMHYTETCIHCNFMGIFDEDDDWEYK